MKYKIKIAKQTKGRDTSERIIMEAVGLFWEHGFTNTSTRKLSGAIGMSCSAIYNHFESKEEILFIIIRRTGEKILTRLTKAIEQYPTNPSGRLRQKIKAMFSLFKSSEMRKEIAIFIDELSQLPEKLKSTCVAQHRNIFDLFYKDLCELRRNKAGHTTNEKVFTFTILSSMIWVNQWYKDDGPISLDSLADYFIQLIFNGLDLEIGQSGFLKCNSL